MKYVFKPKKFYLITLAVTWLMWSIAAVCSHQEGSGWYDAAMVLMFMGLVVPCGVAFIFVKKSKSTMLKKDYKEKLWGFFRINFKNLIVASIVFFLIIGASIFISLLFGESLGQFKFAGDFSFSIGGVPTLIVILLTAVFEELGWRGYAEDSIAQYHSWFMESIIFGVLWAAWHIPLFFIQGTYQANILELSPWYMINFFAGMMPLGFIFTWVYVGNNRSIFACSIFHFIVNFLQEQIDMTQNTKCIESVVLLFVSVIVVLCNKDMFFEKRHIGNILPEEK